MKQRICALLLAVILVGGTGCGTARAGQVEQSGPAATSATPPDIKAGSAASLKSASGSGSAETSAAPGQAAGEVREDKPRAAVYLPTYLADFGNLLTGMAEEEGFTLEVHTSPAGTRYAGRLAERLETSDDVALFWIEDEAAARELQAGGGGFTNLLEGGTHTALRSLAKMTPESIRILDKEKVYGLPLGLYGSGTLVDLTMAADLLGSEDTAAVYRDLVNCTPAQWAEFVATVSTYLNAPQKTNIALAERDYIIRRYRPEEAKQLRSVFALPTGEGSGMLEVPLAAAMAARYDTPAALLDATPAQRAEASQVPLGALLDLLDTETKYMAGREGPLARGEELAGIELTSETMAESLFGEGTALFLQGDTRLGLKLEAEYPRLSGRLALIPTKLPLPEEDSARNLYKQTGVGTQGLLCVNPQAAGHKLGEALLLRLYASPEGQEYIESQLNLLPLTMLYSGSPLLARLGDAVAAGETYPLVVSSSALSSASSTLSRWVTQELLYLEEWDEEVRSNWFTVTRSVLGFPLEEEPQPEGNGP